MLSGGGARGAYQVGVLQYLARQFPSAIPEVLTGVSAGAINAAFLAARQEPFVQKLDELAEMWSNLRIDAGVPRRRHRPDAGARCAGAAGWCRAASRR